MQRLVRFQLAMVCMLSMWVSFSACGVKTGSVTSPQVTVSKIKVEDINLFEAVVRVEMRFINVNDDPVDFKGMNCELHVDNIRLATGVSNLPIHIPSRQTAVIPITVYSSVEDMTRVIRDIRSKDKVTYEMNGKLYMDGGLFKPDSLAFQSKGEISLEGLKAFRM
ncbi:MAG: LEA type 2 family protein [Thermodesulfobacteriota bacterium]